MRPLPRFLCTSTPPTPSQLLRSRLLTKPHIFAARLTRSYSSSSSPSPGRKAVKSPLLSTFFSRNTLLEKSSPPPPSQEFPMATTKTGQPLDRGTLDTLLRRRLFYTPSFEIYGGVSGLYDYGPPGCALQANIVDTWRKHFVLEEDMMEVDCTMLTPHEVLKTSGHVDKFADWMCKDPKSGEIFRADHLVEEVLEARLKGDKEARGIKVEEEEEEDDKKKKKKKKVKEIKAVKLDDEVVKEYEEVLAKIDNYDGKELGELIVKYNITNPATGNTLEPPVAFNLMFGTSIGPSSNLPGYLRPETAQGQFLTFSKLYEFNNAKMPFASASIGKSFRNEISPKSGLLRVREFLMAEIEHFVDPHHKLHPRFAEVKDISLRFLDRHIQQSGKTTVVTKTIGEAVAQGMVDNETLGYFLARIYLFLVEIGVDPEKLRFRQHMPNEMAHYAADCWDAELLTSYGWIECVGCADRSAYDLTVHSKKTGSPLVVRENLETPIVWEEWDIDVNKKWMGPRFRGDASKVQAAIDAIPQAQREILAAQKPTDAPLMITVEGLGEVELDKKEVQIVKRKKQEFTREYTPNVIEPSFGIGRILYSLMEHVYYSRPEDAARGVLAFPPKIAPTKVLIVPLSSNKDFDPIVGQIGQVMRKEGIANRVDASSATIGKRYARNDELGTPFGVTVDFQTLKDGTVTLRERDTMKQVRSSIEDIVAVVKNIIEGRESWEMVVERLGEFQGQELEN